MATHQTTDISTGAAPSGVLNVAIGKKALASMITLLKDVGINADGLSSLKRDGVIKLASLVEEGGQKGALVIKMFNSTSESNFKLLGKLVDTLYEYTGSFPILEHFLNNVGYTDPYLAVSKAQVLLLPAEELKTTRGVSGHILTGLTYCVYNVDAPNSTVGYFSKKQAITKILEAFDTGYVAESRHTVKTRRNSALREHLMELSLSDIEQDPSLVASAGSPLLARNLEVYRELREAIANYREQMSNLVYGGSLIQNGVDSLKVKGDVGRQFYGWFAEHLKENPNVPRGIRLAYESLVDPDVSLTGEEERNYLSGLLAYQRVHSFINKDVAVAGLVKDLAEYQSLPPQDPLRLDPALESARMELQATLSGNSQEMTVAAFGNTLELSGMVAFRRAMNERRLALYGAEFTEALKHFEFVSFKDGKWREDALADSVPMERLKLSLYGAKVGVAELHFSSSRKQATLTQADFKQVMTAQFLNRFASEPEKFVNSLSIPDFREMVDGVIVAYRKAKFMDARLEEFLATPKGAGITVDRENIGETLENWKPALLVGTKFHTVESWPGSRDADGSPALPLQELAKRLVNRQEVLRKSTFAIEGIYVKNKRALEVEIPAGLYTGEVLPLIEEARAKLIPMVSAADYRNELDRVARLSTNKMIEYLGIGTNVLSKEYLFLQEVEQIQVLLTIEDDLRKKTENFEPEKLAELGQWADRMRQVQVFTGGLTSDGRRLTLGQSALNDELGRTSVVRDDMRITYFDPEIIEARKKQIESDFVRLNSLDAGWTDRARTLCSSIGKSKLAQHSMMLVGNSTFQAARNLRRGPDFVSKEFVEAVNRIYPAR